MDSLHVFSEQEMVGAMKFSIAHDMGKEVEYALVEVGGPCCRTRNEDGSYHACHFSEVSFTRVSDIVGLSANSEDNGLESLEGKVDLELTTGIVGPLSICGPFNETSNSKVKRKKKVGDLYGKSSKSTPIVRGKRRAKQELLDAEKAGQEEYLDWSERSVSDEDIEHRNSILRKEAEATWEIGAMLGLVFDKNRSQMIEVFQRMEEMDRDGSVN
ncbi:hypothetical protein DITRI_Ditri09bG0093900 [Diplodiscus trichospermus]